jgi:excisionase family DNA binding protein
MDKESHHEVLTVKEVSSLLRVNSSTIYMLIRTGQIPTFRVGSEWRFRRDQIERWIAERTRG